MREEGNHPIANSELFIFAIVKGSRILVGVEYGHLDMRNKSKCLMVKEIFMNTYR